MNPPQNNKLREKIGDIYAAPNSKFFSFTVVTVCAFGNARCDLLYLPKTYL